MPTVDLSFCVKLVRIKLNKLQINGCAKYQIYQICQKILAIITAAMLQYLTMVKMGITGFSIVTQVKMEPGYSLQLNKSNIEDCK